MRQITKNEKKNIHKVWFAKYALTKDLYEKEVVKTSEDGIPSMGRHGMMLSMAKVKTVDIMKNMKVLFVNAMKNIAWSSCF